MKFKILSFLTILLFCSQTLVAQTTRLLREPDVSANKIVFAYAGDIWLADINGGHAIRLTSFKGVESDPNFSPDGSMVAFTGEYAGNTDVFVVSVEGGAPRRLTWHPLADLARGWTNDGKSVIFASGRTSAPRAYTKFWTINLEKAYPKPLPIPRVYNGNFSPDGNHFAYQPIKLNDKEWRNYRGGQTNPIWVMDMSDFTINKLPWEGSKDLNPVWSGDTIYFMSDRDYAMNVYGYAPSTGELKQLTHYSKFDVKQLNAGSDWLVYEKGGYIFKLNPQNGEAQKVDITVKGDFPWARPHWEEVGNQITNASLSATGARALVQARGEIFTIPTQKGDYRNITNSSAAADRFPAWSPNGKYIAWFSDESGEYQLMIAKQKGLEEPRVIDIPNPTFYYETAWSPNSKYILFTDEALNIWYVDVETGKITKVDQGRYSAPLRTLAPEWSPDSKWIAYSKRLESQYHVIKAYSLEQDKSFRITDGMSDAISPAWDASGKYLYFLASTNFALHTGWLDMSSYGRAVLRDIYFVVLEKGQPSPLLPESDEEKIGKEEKDEKADSTVTIDFDGIDQRILSLNVPERTYLTLETGQKGELFYTEQVNNVGNVLHKYSLDKRKTIEFIKPMQFFALSQDGKKLLYQSRGTWGVVPTSKPVKVGEGKINTNISMYLEPQKEWQQIFDEAWRFERDFFYVDNSHGANWQQVYEKYEPWVDAVRHRSDLTYILDILGGELSVGHSFVGGGDEPDVDREPIGMLGADYSIENNLYRIVNIYDGENWNPDLRAPLRAPGIDVEAGDYILAVNGVELTGDMNIYKAFAGKAGRQTIVTVNNQPTKEGAHNVTVVPVGNERTLRTFAWVEGNRRKVTEMSDGQLGYVWLPNTSNAGYTFFNRYYFAQQNKKGIIVDERFNGGGSAADYMIDIMNRELHGFFNNPVNEDLPFTSPGAGIWGPKVMIVNETAGSGGDYLPYMFKQMEIGPIVGTTTWGGLVGIWGTPALVDGGSITSPRGGFYNLDGEWDVENIGVSPDYEVEMLPAQVNAGHDPQLEKAIEVALKLLENWPNEIITQPDDPVRVKRPQNSDSH